MQSTRRDVERLALVFRVAEPSKARQIDLNLTPAEALAMGTHYTQAITVSPWLFIRRGRAGQVCLN